MYFISLILAAITVTVANSYTIDPNLENGVHFIPLLTNSTEVPGSEAVYGESIRIGDIVFSATDYSERSVVGKVPVPSTSIDCYHGTESRWAHDGAFNSLKETCDSGVKIPRHGSVASGLLIARYGSSIAYACSWGDRQGCAPNEIENVWSQIGGLCGELSGGEACVRHWKKCYGYSTFRSVICSNEIM
ncbi:hypothetical protein E0Z10_g7878 [Xylaria hypoxylon]|uniref:Ecp2 effector protein domain-containing protein n=1 Tax=Xylaria hypoxylon TaxID=37992 RepID=A0A4Z0YQY6_9PEZI|nr:hypothetical protein E0Z10_g7878 [Xylaria hypoxylon]